MKQFFATRQIARDFANANGVKVQDAGSDMPKGSRWFVEVQDPVQETTPVQVQETLKINRPKRVVINSFDQLGTLVKSRQPDAIVTQVRHGKQKKVSVYKKHSRI